MRIRWPWLVIPALMILGAVGFRVFYVERPRYLTIHEAIRAGDLVDVKYHLSHGTELTELDASGYTLLHSAALYHRPEVAQLLLSRGLDADRIKEGRTVRSYTALHLAARENTHEVATLLLAGGADPHARDTEGLTPLHLAARNDSVEVARVLLEHDANVNARDNHGQTPLGMAVKWKKPHVGRVLVQYHGVK